jgi:serine/threonine protein kinase
MYEFVEFFLFIFILDLLKEELGSGGFGDVYKVEKILTKEELVMKVMRLGKESEAEIKVGISLGSSCKYLVQLVDFFMEGGCCCLIMEHCSGGNLEKVLEEGKRIEQPVFFFCYVNCFILKELLKITNNVMKGLKRLHEEKIIYCDLKASDIFVTVDGIYKLGLLIIVVLFYINRKLQHCSSF